MFRISFSVGLEAPERSVLLVNWKTREDHTTGFRQSAQYQQWRLLLHDFYQPFALEEHHEMVTAG